MAALAAVALYAAGLAAQQPQQIRTAKQMPFPAKPDWARLEVETLPVQGQVHMIAGAGGNIAVQAGNQGVLLVDTGYEQMSAKRSEERRVGNECGCRGGRGHADEIEPV